MQSIFMKNILFMMNITEPALEESERYLVCVFYQHPYFPLLPILTIRTEHMPAQLSRYQKSPVIQKLQEVAPGICEQFGVQRIGIFGSYARGDQKPSSNVDILVELEEGFSTLINFVGLADHLEQILQLKVDLLTVQGIDPYIRSYVESEVIWIEG